MENENKKNNEMINIDSFLDSFVEIMKNHNCPKFIELMMTFKKLFNETKELSKLPSLEKMKMMIKFLIERMQITDEEFDSYDINSKKSYLTFLLLCDKLDDVKRFFNHIISNNQNIPLYKSIGDSYYYGISNHQYFDKAKECFDKANEMNDNEDSIYKFVSDYYFYLGMELYQQEEYLMASLYYRKALILGNLAAGFELSGIYDDKLIPDVSEEENYKETINVLKVIIEQGERDMIYKPNELDKVTLGRAYNNLGYFLLDSNERNDNTNKKIFEYFTKSSQLGNINGTYHLGLVYYYGVGVSKDTELALNYLKESANQGSEDAVNLIKEIEESKKSGK